MCKIMPGRNMARPLSIPRSTSRVAHTKTGQPNVYAPIAYTATCHGLGDAGSDLPNATEGASPVTLSRKHAGLQLFVKFCERTLSSSLQGVQARSRALFSGNLLPRAASSSSVPVL